MAGGSSLSLDGGTEAAVGCVVRSCIWRAAVKAPANASARSWDCQLKNSCRFSDVLNCCTRQMAGIIRDGITTDANLRSNGMSGIELGRTLHTIVFSDCQAGLGIKVIGGIAEEDEDDKDFGIFIKKVLPGGVAAVDGRLQEADQLIEVNGQNLERVTNEEAVQCLRLASASDYIQLVVCRDLQGREEYIELLNNYSYSSASSVYEQSSARDMQYQGSKEVLGIPEGRAQSSRSITPTNHIRTPKSPIHTPRLSDKVPGESSSASDMDFNSPRLRPNSSPPFSSLYTHSDLPFFSTQSLHRAPKVPNAAAASVHGVLAPSLASTPQQYMGSVPNIKYSPPDGASGATSSHSQMVYEPSPVVNTSDPNNFQPSLLLSDISYGMGFSRREEENASYPGLSRKLSLESGVRLPFGKLEVALRYLGIEPTPEQRAHLRRKLTVDTDGMVSYGEFVRTSREVFQVELQQRKVTPAAFYLASPGAPDPFLQVSHQPVGSPSAVQRDNNLLEQELARVQREREILSQEVERLKALLKEKEESSFMTDDEMHRLKKEAQSAVQENRALKTKVYLAEQAQKAARNMEQDYAEVIRLLEKELAQLKTHSKVTEKPSVHKRLAVLGCQLRKAEVGKKTYEVATDKLLKLAELVVENLSGRGETQRVNPGNQLSPIQVSNKAKDTILAVRSLLEAEPLPFGWEEAYTAEGDKYYINHVTQCTMWHHPVSMLEQTTLKQTSSNRPQHPPPAPPVTGTTITTSSSSFHATNSSHQQHRHQQPSDDHHKAHTLPRTSQPSKGVKLSPGAVNGALSGPPGAPTQRPPVKNGRVMKLSPRVRGDSSTDTKKKVAETTT